MAKKESNFVNMVTTLAIVTAVAAFTLSMVYNLTAGPIEEGRIARQQEAIRYVLPPTEEMTEFDKLVTKKFLPVTGSDSITFNFAYVDGELLGIAVETYTMRGWEGFISAMVGFYPDKNIVDVVHLEHSETPGLGDKIEKGRDDWSNQFRDFNTSEKELRLKGDGGDVDGITAATITARAYADAIERAYLTLKEVFDEKYLTLEY